MASSFMAQAHSTQAHDTLESDSENESSTEARNEESPCQEVPTDDRLLLLEMAGESPCQATLRDDAMPSWQAPTDDTMPSWQVGYNGGRGNDGSWAGFANARLLSFRSRLCLDEVSGALGDLGTLIPLLTACAKQKTISMGPAMLWLGIFNVISALQWDIPMCVQPMKSICAVAIANGMTPGTFAASGIITGGVVWFLGITRSIGYAHTLVPTSVIAGMQVGLGITMASKGCAYWVPGEWVSSLDGKTTWVICFVAASFMLVRPKWPAALVIFLIGVVLSIVQMAEAGAKVQLAGLHVPLIIPTREDWLHGLLLGALPQLPLTVLNSVVSVCALSVDLFRATEDGGKGASPASVASSVGLMNLVGCWFGGMPSCHGAGGLAGQYKFGARGGCSVLMLGVAKILLALVFGQSVDVLMHYYPKVVLGVLLLFAGVELASVGVRGIAKSPKLDDELLPCFVTAGAYIGTSNIALGVCAGLVVAVLQRCNIVKQLGGLGSLEQLPQPKNGTQEGSHLT